MSVDGCDIFIPLVFIFQVDVPDEIQDVADVDCIRLDDLYREVKVIENRDLFAFFFLLHLFIDGKVLALEIVNLSRINGKEDYASSVKVYPNPFDKFITLEVSSDIVITKAVITNIAGQLVKEVINPDNTISTSELRSGVYFISLHSVDGIAKTERIIKR